MPFSSPRTPSRTPVSQRSAQPKARFGIPWHKIFLGILLLQVVPLLLLHSKLSEHVEQQHYSSGSHNPLSPFEQVVSNQLRLAPKPKHHVLSGGNRRDGYATIDGTYLNMLHQMEFHVRQTQKSDTIHSCRYHADTGDYAVTTRCPPNKPVLYYNPLQQERILCGHAVPPKGILELPQECLEPSRLYKTIPDATSVHGIPAVTVRFDDPHQTRTVTLFEDCDVPCYEAGRPSIVCQRTVDDTDWSFVFSMEGPKYYRTLEINPKDYKRHHYYSTTSYQSEIPLPYYSWAEYQIQQPAVQYDEAIKGAVFLARNCRSQNNREAVVRALQNSTFRVDSLSSCLRNANPPPGLSLKNKTAVMQHYLFYLAFENQNVDDYITEKLWGPFQSGTVPVYFGARNVHEHAPPHSIIAVTDFDSIDDLVAHLHKVAANKTLYEAYHKWRTQPLPDSFHRQYDFTAVHSTCRTCRWAAAQKHGLGWNHSNQSLRALRSGSRDVCLTPSMDNPPSGLSAAGGRVVQPFREVWTADSAERSEIVLLSSCQSLGPSKSVALVENGQIRRTVWQQDGVIDFLFENAAVKQSVVLYLETALELSTQPLERVALGHARLQDHRNETRMTLLTSPTALRVETAAGVGRPAGVLQLNIEPVHLPVRLRVIIEDVDTFHKGAEREENYFGQVMAEDFFNQIEAFVDLGDDTHAS